MPGFPMFPLGSVLFPGLVLPLQVFEPRYRALLDDVLGEDAEARREFGVCLIERGSEVGGGDVRTDVGTVARIEEATELPDGRWAVIAVGTRRIRVVRWLSDDPYPRAEVVDLPDPTPDPADVAGLPDIVASLRSALAKAGELGDTSTPATIQLAEDPVVASHQMAAVAPISTIDRYELLAAETPVARLDRLAELLTDAHELLDLRLGSPGDDRAS